MQQPMAGKLRTSSGITAAAAAGVIDVHRQDVETLKPGTSVNLAREITPDMLKVRN